MVPLADINYRWRGPLLYRLPCCGASPSWLSEQGGRGQGCYITQPPGSFAVARLIAGSLSTMDELCPLSPRRADGRVPRAPSNPHQPPQHAASGASPGAISGGLVLEMLGVLLVTREVELCEDGCSLWQAVWTGLGCLWDCCRLT